jgi:hypothetical protein
MLRNYERVQRTRQIRFVGLRGRIFAQLPRAGSSPASPTSCCTRRNSCRR